MCGDLKLASVAAQCGYDYFEWTVPGLLVPQQDNAAFASILDQLKSIPLPCEALNQFIPAELKIVGPGATTAALARHVDLVTARASRAGISIITFGSGGARNVPEGFDRNKAFEQITAFGKMAARFAYDRGVLVCVEPLNRRECNILNTVSECELLVKAIDHPGFRLTVDGYHWGMEKEIPQSIQQVGPLIRHAHIATWPTRFFPGGEPCDLAPFINALTATGYTGRLSIEGKIPNPAADLPTARALLGTLCQAGQQPASGAWRPIPKGSNLY